MFALGCPSQQLPPEWVSIIEINFSTGGAVDATGRHSPVNYNGAFLDGTYVSNQDGRIFTDGYGVDHPDFDLTGQDFRVLIDINPSSIGNDYVWGKGVGNNLGINLKLGLSGSDPVVYVWPMTVDLGAVTPGLLNTWSTIEVRREGTLWTLLRDGAIIAGPLATTGAPLGWEGGETFQGFLLAGALNTARYSGAIDNFRVQVKS